MTRNIIGDTNVFKSWVAGSTRVKSDPTRKKHSSLSDLFQKSRRVSDGELDLSRKSRTIKSTGHLPLDEAVKAIGLTNLGIGTVQNSRHEAIDKQFNLAQEMIGEYESKNTDSSQLIEEKPLLAAQLYKGCPKEECRDAREEFLRAFQEHLKLQEPCSKHMRRPKTKLEAFFGNDKELMTKFKKAIEEERNSKTFRRAVFLAATEKGSLHPSKKVVVYTGGASGVGKTFVGRAFFKMIKSRNGVEGKGNGYIVRVDGGIDRETSQIRNMVLKASLADGYGGVSNLHKHANTRVKDIIYKAAMKGGSQMHVMIPETFVENLPGFVKRMTKLGKKSNIQQVYTEVRADRTVDKALKEKISAARAKNDSDAVSRLKKLRKEIRQAAKESHQMTTKGNGESRAYLSHLEEYGWDQVTMNGKPPVESKKYQAKYFTLGVACSKKAKQAFRKVVKPANRMVLANESDNMHVSWNSEKNSFEQTADNPQIMHVSKREIKLWEMLKKGDENLIRNALSEFGLEDIDDAYKLINKNYIVDLETPEESLKELIKILGDNKIRAQLKITENNSSDRRRAGG